MRRVVVAAILALAGCATTGASDRRDQVGEALLAKEAYGEAEAFYRKALEGRPGDGDLQRGLSRARSGWVRKALQRVRSLRLSGSLDEALDGMKRVVLQARAWEMAIPADTGPEYDQEAALLVTALDDRLRPLWTRPLAVSRFLEQYRDVFGDGYEGVRLWNARQEQVVQAGTTHCEALWRLASPRAPFFAEFLARYCAVFGVQKTLDSSFRLALATGRFGVLETGAFRVAGLEEGELGDLKDRISEAFQATPWFDPRSASRVVVEARGALVARSESEDIPLEHPYVLQVPYSDLEEYCEWTQVPVATTRWENGRQVPVTETRSECRPRTREVQKVRIEPQVLRFSGRRIRQSLRLQVEATMRLGDQSFRASVSDALEETDVTHDVDRPDIGLHRDPLELTPRRDWVQGRSQRLSEELRDRLREAWRARWCDGTAPETLDLQADAHLRCLALSPDVPDAVAVWSRTLFGLEPREMLESLGWGGAAGASRRPAGTQESP
ncbi:MAG TPA: hypothetical protein PLQ97_09115 [Myxococcota bacterium]|nr:hypothetical protein [Myxococcota bacterium]HQK50938.1 hypothetical protein [Myxococcota bacterium]